MKQSGRRLLLLVLKTLQVQWLLLFIVKTTQVQRPLLLLALKTLQS